MRRGGPSREVADDLPECLIDLDLEIDSFKCGKAGTVIDRDRIRKVAEKTTSADDPSTTPVLSTRQSLIEFLTDIEPDLKQMEKVLVDLKEASRRPAGRFGKLASADSTGRYLGVRIVAAEQRALQGRAAECLEQARLHDRIERARRRTRGRKSRPEIESDDQRLTSDRLEHALKTLEAFVLESSRMAIL